MALVVINVLTNVQQFGLAFFSVWQERWYVGKDDCVLYEIEFKVKEKFLGTQTVNNYFGYLELKKLINIPGAEISNLCTNINKNDRKWYIFNFPVC
jgi:hypothetical protein